MGSNLADCDSQALLTIDHYAPPVLTVRGLGVPRRSR
jgi:hypothetical protein